MIKPRWIKTSKERFPKGEWFVEFFTKGEFHAHQIKRIIGSYKTEFQTATLVETYSFGKVLVIDRETQSSELDEFIYHESLVVPAIMLSKQPPRVFAILGGGEGATAREILNYQLTQKVIMVDIDHNILKFARAYLSSWHKGSFDDDRLILLAQDAKKFIENTKVKFDIIYSDLPSPIEGGPAYQLYTIEFYKTLKQRLTKKGIFVTQAGPGHILHLQLHAALYHTLKKVFKNVLSYASYVPSYDLPWAYLIASDTDLTPSQSLIKKHLVNFKNGFRYIDPYKLESLLTMPPYIKTVIEKNRKIISQKNPMFFSTSRY